MSSHNPRIARLAKLIRHRSAREEEGRFVVEGPLLVAEALASGARVQEVYVGDDATGDPSITEVTQRAVDADLSVWSVPGAALRRAVDTVTPRPVAALVEREPAGLEAVVTSGSLVLLLAGVADPGNAGTLMRTAEACGAAAVICTDASTDPFGPKCVRASAGAVFHVPVVLGGPTVAMLEELGQRGFRRIGTAARGGRPPDVVELTGSAVLALGNEAHGLPAPASSLVDELVTIPTVGRGESLNVAMAGAIVCAEALRQRQGGQRR